MEAFAKKTTNVKMVLEREEKQRRNETKELNEANTKSNSKKRSRSKLELDKNAAPTPKKRKVVLLHETASATNSRKNEKSNVSDHKEDVNLKNEQIPFLLTFDTEVNGWRPLDEKGQRRTGADPGGLQCGHGGRRGARGGSAEEFQGDVSGPGAHAWRD